MFKIGIIEEFQAIHSLKGDFGLENRLHGHSYKVELTIEGGQLDEAGILYDISKLRGKLKEILSYFHYQNLNELEGLRGVNPTVENVCKYIHQRMASTLRNEGLQGLEVTVWESPTGFASYRESLSN